MRCVAIITLPIVLGCAGPAPAHVDAYDSAGVAIVETPAGSLAAAPAWHVADSAVLQIGTEQGKPAYLFHQVVGVRRLPDGRIVVADGGSSEIRFFDADGRHLSSRGRAGDAPGEYRLITGIGVGPGDSLWVYDFGLRRFSVLTDSGVVARTVSVGPALSAVTAVGRLASGPFIVREQWSAATHGEARIGLVRDSAAVARLSADGRALDTVVLAPGREIFIGTENGRGVMSAPLFARHAAAALRDSLVFVGDQAAYEIRAYAPDGGLRRVVRVSGVDLAIGQEDVRRATDTLLAGEPDAHRARMQAHYAAMTVPPTRPAFGPLLVDDRGNLWVGSFELRGPPRSWTVFEPGGRLRAAVTVPGRTRLHQIVGDLAVATWEDPLGVEYVRVHALVREAP